MDQTIIYRGRPFRLRNPGAQTLLRRAVAKHDTGHRVAARRLVSLAVRIEAGLVTSAEAFDAADKVLRAATTDQHILCRFLHASA